MTDFKRLIAWHEAEGCRFAEFMATDDRYRRRVEVHRETAHILAVLEAARANCDFGPLRELNDGRPDVLCLDFTGPADTLRDLAELLGGGN